MRLDHVVPPFLGRREAPCTYRPRKETFKLSPSQLRWERVREGGGRTMGSPFAWWIRASGSCVSVICFAGVSKKMLSGKRATYEFQEPFLGEYLSAFLRHLSISQRRLDIHMATLTSDRRTTHARMFRPVMTLQCLLRCKLPRRRCTKGPKGTRPLCGCRLRTRLFGLRTRRRGRCASAFHGCVAYRARARARGIRHADAPSWEGG